MTSEFKEGKINPDGLKNVQSRIRMTQRIDNLGRDNPNLYTMSGLYTISSELQSRLLSIDDSMWPTEVRNGLLQSGTEFAARVAPTLIDRSKISLSYEQGNLNAWLRNKGLGVELDPNKRFDYSVDWHELPQGSQEMDYYFSKLRFNPQELGVLAENVTAKYETMRDRARKLYGSDSEQAKLLDMAAAMELALSAEIGSIISGQGGLTAEQVKELVGPQLKAVGLSLMEKGK